MVTSAPQTFADVQHALPKESHRQHWGRIEQFLTTVGGPRFEGVRDHKTDPHLEGVIIGLDEFGADSIYKHRAVFVRPKDSTGPFELLRERHGPTEYFEPSDPDAPPG
jgi:hypothetical protein